MGLSTERYNQDGSAASVKTSLGAQPSARRGGDRGWQVRRGDRRGGVPQRKGDPIMISIDEGVRGEDDRRVAGPSCAVPSRRTHDHRRQTLPDLRRRRGGPGHVGRALRTTRLTPLANSSVTARSPAPTPHFSPAFARHPSGGKKVGPRRQGSGPLEINEAFAASARLAGRSRHRRSQGQRERRGHRARSPGRHVGHAPRALGVDRTASTRRGVAAVALCGGGGQGDAALLRSL